MNHVVMVIPSLGRIGGAERQTILLAKGLRRRSWRVSVIALSGVGGQLAADLAAEGVGFLSLEMRKGLADPRGWLRFHRWLRCERPDVVHAHLHHPAWLARWSRLAAPVRVVVDTLHSSSTGTMSRKLGYRISNWLPDQVTAVSQAVADAHLFDRMVIPAKVAVLPNGVDTDEWKPDVQVRAALRRELGLDGEFVWLSAGRLDAVKDYPTLLKAMVGLPGPARLVIAGGGPLESELRRLGQELGLEQRVRFLAFQTDVRRWMQAADGFVLSSLWEGLPVALLEAAACEVPAVATDVPGTREVIVEGQTGALAAAGSALSLQGEMKRIMRMPVEERQAMGRQARQLVLDRFSLDAVLDQWEGLYTDLLSRSSRPFRHG